MKDLKTLLNKYLPDECDENQIINVLLEKGKQKYILPTEAKNISCSLCNGKRGFLVKSGENKNYLGWSCLNEDCLRECLIKKRFKIKATR